MRSSVVTIVAFDAMRNLATFPTPDGPARSVFVGTPEKQKLARGFKPGDEIEVEFTEFFAIKIEEVSGP